jgi:hypothetical protein
MASADAKREGATASAASVEAISGTVKAYSSK